MATDINEVVLCGRLVASMETRTTPSGYMIGSFTMAVNRSRKNKDGNWEDKASFIDCTLYGQSVKNLQPYLFKGKQVCISGYLDQDRWEKDGQKFSRIKVAVENIQLVGGKPGDGNHGAEVPSSQPPAPEGSWKDDEIDDSMPF